MDPNRYAEPHEREALRASIRAATEALDQARRNLDAATAARLEADAAAAARLEAEARESEAKAALKAAQRKFDDDPDLRRQSGLLHPIRRLPAEILGYIFTLAAREWLNYTSDCARAPFRIAAVSRRWRDVALRTPSVWRHIRTVLNEADSTYTQSYRLWFDLAAERSGYRDIVLVTELYYGPASLPALQRLRDLLARNSVTALDLYCHHTVQNFHWDILRTATPVTSLTSLCISDYQCHRELVYGLPTTAPNLRAITASFPHFDLPLPVPHLSVTYAEIRPRLYTFPLGTEHGRNISVVFTAYPNAKTVFVDHPEVAQPFPGILQHDALTSLHIRRTGGFSVLSNGFSFPALRRLTLEVNDRHSHAADETSGSLHLISSGLPALRTLEYDALSDLGVLVPALRTLPLLESLVCKRGKPDDAFLTAFIAGPDFLCPALAELHTGKVETSQLAQQFVDAVSARIDAHLTGSRVTKLRSVSADFGYGPRFDNYKTCLSSLLLP
ncbi:hypothetical protein EXIGLDRAFT_726504 [Exidia glandulosa HHB12029]|uniref:F-box domain-containing protein n=1 Tax=Exidia glandulosa HHB12029 TaxID=1314781 RepID=A0A166B904_EXIGL|nr:hypothetical protein EXIGLDRAFT_726504 [Exidia glandulosa HHB12029]